jgi:hypothetical protein
VGMGQWGMAPIPNPQSPIPNPQSPWIKNKDIHNLYKYHLKYYLKLFNIKKKNKLSKWY